MSSSLEALIPELQQPARELFNVASYAGVRPQITSTLRTHSEQARLYKRFLAGNSKYPAAAPGTSAHEYGYAFDMIVNGDQNQFDLGTVWKSWGGVWHESDNIHFEYPGFIPGPAEPVGLDLSVSSEYAPGGIAGLANTLSGFFPHFGTVQLYEDILHAMHLSQPEVHYYFQHPTEFFRDAFKLGFFTGFPFPTF